MARKLKSDRILFLTTVVLASISILMVYSASVPIARAKWEDPYRFLTKQVMWGALGMAFLSVVMRIDYSFYRRPAFIWTALLAVTSCLVAVLFMPAHNRTHRWFGVGGLGIQPSEFAKLVAIVFTAALLERRMHRINDARYALVPVAVVVGGLIALILPQPDLGTGVSLGLIVAAMVFAAGLSYGYVVGALLAAVPAVAALVIFFPYRQRRMVAFLDPWADPLGNGYQIIQSLIAVGSGGLWGSGLMNGVQKLFYLPEPHTDFIYAVIAEELGLIGATALVICFAVVAWRGLRIALRAPDSFGAFLALGITTMIVTQALVNISVVLGLMPTKGIPLPFVSFGGSSLIVNFLGMGILLNVSQRASTET
jgi:cell division protein FtsW